jgi:hypothetical protein
LRLSRTQRKRDVEDEEEDEEENGEEEEESEGDEEEEGLCSPTLDMLRRRKNQSHNEKLVSETIEGWNVEHGKVSN